MNFQYTKFFLLIVFLLCPYDQRLLGQDTETNEDICGKKIYSLYVEYIQEKDVEKKYQKAKALLDGDGKDGCGSFDDSFGPHGIRKFIKKYELNEIRTKCVDADKAFFSIPNLANLNAMISACGAWIKKSPTPDYYFPTRLGVATGFGLLAGIYQDTDQTFLFAEKALESLKEETVPRDWKEKDWLQFRQENIGRLLQYQGLSKLRQSQADTEKGIDFLTKAAALKNGPAYRDTNTYLLRAEANMASCSKIKEVLDAKNNKPQRNEPPLLEVCPVVENVIQDYARVDALLFLFPIDNVKNYDVRGELTRLWNFTYPDSPRKKLNDLINSYKAEFRKK